MVQGSGSVVQVCGVPSLYVTVSCQVPAARSTAPEVRPWKLPVNEYEYVAGNVAPAMVSTLSWLCVPAKEPSGLMVALDSVKVSLNVLPLGTHASALKMVTSWT